MVVKPQSSLSKPKIAGHALDDAQLSGLLASLELNLSNLVTARDPQTVELAYELQNAIDNIRAELTAACTRSGP
jgi:hypothetical protein